MIAVAEEPVQAVNGRPMPVDKVEPRVDSRIVLNAVDWEDYTKFLEAGGKRRIRFTYDRGTLEIMTVSNIHEWWKTRIALLIRYLCVYIDIEIQGCGNTTLRRRDLERGIEPDEGLYVRSTPILGPKNIDLQKDPPPNLGIEIDISSSSLDRQSIYAALRVAEIWRFDGDTILVYRLNTEGGYEVVTQSGHFPMLPMDEFQSFLLETKDLGETKLFHQFQKWLQAHIKREERPGQDAN